MISLKESFLALVGVVLGGVAVYIAKPTGTFHYSLHSPQNLARLAKGREIRRQQQRAMSAGKRAEKIRRYQEKIKKLI